MLAEAPEINLRHQLDILLDPKYKSQADWDDRYTEAKEAAQMTLSMLKEQAQEKEAEVKTIVETLLTVSRKTPIIRQQLDVAIPPEISIQANEIISLKRTQWKTWRASSTSRNSTRRAL